MDKTFADRVHAAAAAIAGGMWADPNMEGYDDHTVAGFAVDLVLAVDAAIAARQGERQAMHIAPDPQAIEEAYQRGLADGRASPWRPSTDKMPELVIAYDSYRDTLLLKAPQSVRPGELWVAAPPIAAPPSSR
jgi:hypothetical protein